MKSLQNNKVHIVSRMQELLDEKINEYKAAIAEAMESRNSDTKSSAGDKFETGRAMIQMEIDKSEAQLAKTINMKAELDQIKFDKNNSSVGFGSLVITNNETYLVAVSMGVIHLDDQNIYAISLASPIGEILNRKKQGDQFEFRGRNYLINQII